MSLAQIFFTSSFVLQFFLPCAQENEVRIGAILSYNRPRFQKSPEEIAFFLAIDKVNNDGSFLRGKPLRGYVERVDPDDDYDNIHKANKLLTLGVVALIGPLTSAAIPVTGPLTSMAHIPQILPLTSWDTSDLNSQEYGYLLRMSPSEKLKARALIDIVRYYKWKRVAVLGLRGDDYKEYAQGKNAFRILAAEHEIDVPLDRLFPPDPISKRKIKPIRELRSLSNADLRVVVVFCPSWAVRELLESAYARNKRGKKIIHLEEWAWVFSDLGNSDKDLVGSARVVPPFMRGLIGLRPSIGKGVAFRNLQDKFEKKMNMLNRSAEITASAGYVFDSVLMAAKGIHDTLDQGTKLSSSQTSIGICSSKNQVKEGGSELYHNIRKATMEGAMNDLSFEETGEPRCANYDVINVRDTGSVKVAEWDTTGGLTKMNESNVIWMSGRKKVPFDIPNYLRNKTVEVVTVLAPPFVMRKKSSHRGNNETEEFEGLSIDILNYMSEELGFRYKIFLAPDGKFGTRDRTTGKWNGVMREVIDQRAKLSIAPLTINSDGQNVVDFTHPYMTFGIAFVMRVTEVDENYFRFLMPYHRTLWIAICGMVVTMGIVLWTFSLLSPFGYYGRYAQQPNKLKVKREIKATKTTFSFVNAIWSSWLCYLRQGGQHPASLSGKMAVSVFWFAIMIFNATYTANLAAHLTVSRMQTPIESVEDLALQTKIQYGTLMDSQLQKFFLDTDVPRFLVMGQFMEQRKTWMPDYDTAIERVMKTNFAFIADRPILEYIARQKKYCGKLKVIGGFGTTYGYGFALRHQSPTTKLFNMEIFRLQRDLIIDQLKHKWSGKETCAVVENLKTENGKAGSTFIQRVSLSDMFGVFIFMGIGIGLGLIFLIVEWMYASIRDVATKQGPKSYLQALGLRLTRICSDICHKKKEEDLPEDDVSTIENTPSLPPRLPNQWKIRSMDMRQIAPITEEPNGSAYEINSFEVSV